MRKKLLCLIMMSISISLCACGKEEGIDSVEEYGTDAADTYEVAPNNATTVSVVDEAEDTDSDGSIQPMDEILSANITDNYMQIGDMLFKVDGSMSLEDVKARFDSTETGLEFSYELDPFDNTLDIHNPTGFEFEFSSVADLGIQDFTMDDVLNYRKECDENDFTKCQDFLLSDARYVKESDDLRLVNIAYYSMQNSDIDVYYAKGIRSNGTLYDGTTIDKSTLKTFLDEWGVTAVEASDQVRFQSGYGDFFINNPSDELVLNALVNKKPIYYYEGVGDNTSINVYANPKGLRIQEYSPGVYNSDMEITLWHTTYNFNEDGVLIGTGFYNTIAVISSCDMMY